MQMTEASFPEGTPVTGYGPGFFRVGERVVQGGLLVLPSGVSGWAGYEALEAILEEAGAIDVVFVGTGAETRHPPAEMRARLEEAGLGVEAMASPAACRSYNVTLAEGRRIALAALPV